MRIVKVCLLISGLLSGVVFAQNPADQVVTEALKPSLLETNLQHLTDEIGGRVPGTVAMRKAVDWGVAAFKAAGADSVHTENFTIQSSWAEGFTRMSVVAPEQFEVRVVSMAWAPALSPPTASAALKEKIENKFQWKCELPVFGETVSLARSG